MAEHSGTWHDAQGRPCEANGTPLSTIPVLEPCVRCGVRTAIVVCATCRAATETRNPFVLRARANTLPVKVYRP